MNNKGTTTAYTRNTNTTTTTTSKAKQHKPPAPTAKTTVDLSDDDEVMFISAKPAGQCFNTLIFLEVA